VSALFFVGRCRNGRQPLRLVLYLSGDLLEFRLELAAMVGAEEQFTATEQDDAQVCLGDRSGRSDRRPSTGSRGSEQ
jgi:hypothetical protein